MKAPIPNPSPKGEGSVSILKFKMLYISKGSRIKNVEYFQPFVRVENFQPLPTSQTSTTHTLMIGENNNIGRQ
jgi:hypothetical protein